MQRSQLLYQEMKNIVRHKGFYILIPFGPVCCMASWILLNKYRSFFAEGTRFIISPHVYKIHVFAFLWNVLNIDTCSFLEASQARISKLILQFSLSELDSALLWKGLLWPFLLNTTIYDGFKFVNWCEKCVKDSYMDEIVFAFKKASKCLGSSFVAYCECKSTLSLESAL